MYLTMLLLANNGFAADKEGVAFFVPGKGTHMGGLNAYSHGYGDFPEDCDEEGFFNLHTDTDRKGGDSATDAGISSEEDDEESIEKLIASGNIMRINDAAYDFMGAGDWKSAADLYKASMKSDKSCYASSRCGLALLRSEKETDRKEGAEYLVQAAIKKDLKVRRVLSSLNKDILGHIDEKRTQVAIDLIAKEAAGKKLTLES